MIDPDNFQQALWDIAGQHNIGERWKSLNAYLLSKNITIVEAFCLKYPVEGSTLALSSFRIKAPLSPSDYISPVGANGASQRYYGGDIAVDVRMGFGSHFSSRSILELTAIDLKTGASFAQLILACRQANISAHLPLITTPCLIFLKCLRTELSDENVNVLSPRERECLKEVAGGARVKQIADDLGLARVTIEMHLKNARIKLGAKTLPGAIARALSQRAL